MRRCARCGDFYENEHACCDLVPKPKPVSQTDAVRPRVRPAHSPVRPVGVDARRYRDPQRRREYKKAYMREWMRRSRNRKRAARVLDKPREAEGPSTLPLYFQIRDRSRFPWLRDAAVERGRSGMGWLAVVVPTLGREKRLS